MAHDRSFTPALGRSELTGDYDRVIAVMTRERRWRSALLAEIAPRREDVIVDVGCGTGTFAIMLSAVQPAAKIIAVDPDPAVLDIARQKAEAAGVTVDWRQAMGDELAPCLGETRATIVTSSLVLHQCPVDMKSAILANMRAVLAPEGRLALADYGEQRTLLMRLLFRQVQQLDGYENTRPNAKGALPGLIAEAGFLGTDEFRCVPTPTGSISLFRAYAPS